MKRFILSLFAALVAVIASNAQQWQELMAAGKQAANEKDYPHAIYFYEEALKQPLPSWEYEHLFHQKLQELYRYLEQFDQAAAHGEKSTALLETNDPSDHFALMLGYTNNALDFYSLNDAENFNKYSGMAVDQLNVEGLPDEDREKMAMLAAFLFRRADLWDKVAEFARKAIEICDDYKGFDPHDYINYHSYCASAYYHLNDYAEAYKYYKKQAELSKEYYGVDSQEYRYAAYTVAQILAFMGDIDGGSKAFSEVAALYRNKIKDQLRILPSSQREGMLSEMIMALQNMIPYGAKAGLTEDEFTVDMYNALLLTKGLLLASDQAESELIAKYATPQVAADFRELNQLRTLLAEKEASAGKDPAEIVALYGRIRELDAQIASACEQYGDISAFTEIDYEAVKKALGPDDVLLDFYDYKPNGDAHKYVCFEIRRNQRYPILHHVFNGEELDSLIRLENNVWSNIYSGEGGEDMWRLIGEPIRQIAGDAKNVYYVPSGAVHRLALDAIPMADGTIGDSYGFRRLSSARQLQSLDQPMPLEREGLFGGLDYNAGLTEIPRDGLALLPQSMKEVEEIEAMVKDQINVEAFTGDRGTEDSFFSMVKNDAPSIIHFSTHGFFYDKKDANIPNSLKLYNDALSLSGLVMAGGNAGWTGVEPSRGILNGTEIAACDLSDVWLVSVASCHSGQGLVTPEGIYGLQRAFKKAGVGSLILSLWDVSDVATKEFMTTFYSNLVNEAMSVNEAFESARTHLRTLYPEPYYWAPFILVD